MKAVVYTGPGRACGSVTEIPYPECKEDQVIVKVMSSAICRDADRMIDSGITTRLDKHPLTPGHEFAGYVWEVGKNVTGWKKGDRIVVDNAYGCGKCYFCLTGDPLHCEDYHSHGHNLQGGMSQYVAVRANQLYAIPDSMSFNAACVAEPVACAVHGVDRLDPKYGETVLVFGAGPHGMSAAMLLNHSNARVICLAPTQAKLDLLAKEGVETILMDRNDSSIHEAEIFKRFPHGVDAVFDTTGGPNVMISAIKMLKPGGRIIQYGAPHDAAQLGQMNFIDFYFKELSIIGAGCQDKCFYRAVEAMSTGVVNTEMMITNEYDLDEYFTALDYNLEHRETIKVVLHPNKE